jgi:hypothetical protein
VILGIYLTAPAPSGYDRSRWRVNLRRLAMHAARLRFELREDRPQGADTRRERVTVAVNDVVKLLGERTQRQLYQIAELGKPAGEPTRAPAFMRLLVDPGQPRIRGEALDFRDEIMAQIYDRGDLSPKRTLIFNIEVTDEGSTHGPAFFQRRRFANWTRIGRLVFSEAVASYNGDFVIHFNHPTWRDDRNDPSTATRVNERKVR